MSLTLERLGRGAAFLLHDDATATTLLLGCGEARSRLLDAATAAGSDSKAANSVDDGSGYDSVESADGGSGGGAGPPLARHVRRYAHKLREVMKRQGADALTAVLVTDYRPEACFMVPFLTEKCALPLAAPDSPPPQCPPIFLTHGTRAIAPHHLAEYWYVTSNRENVLIDFHALGILMLSLSLVITSTALGKETAPLYNAADISAAFRKTQAIGLKARLSVNEHVKITAYHSGHVAGGCAFYIEIGATTILFAHDFNLGGGRVLLPAQIPRLEPSVLITRSSFAVTVSETKTNMERELMRVVHECVSSGGKVVIPVYKLGFFHELMTILLDYWRKMKFTIPIYVSDETMAFPSRFAPLLRRTFTDEFKTLLTDQEGEALSTADIQVFDWKRMQAPGPFVLFTGPASIAHGDSFRAIKACATDPKNLIVLSENCTPGTVNYSLYADPQRKDVAKRLGVNITCGVHYFPCGDEMDARSIVELVAHVAPRQQVLLDYVLPEDMQFIKTHIINRLKIRSSASSGGDGGGTDIPVVSEISQDAGEPTLILASMEIPLKIHKSMFNNPFNVQGMLIAEGAKRKLMLVTAGNGARRLKKKRHTLNFAFSWKKASEPSTRVKKKSARAPSSALAFLLSAPAESTDDDEEPEAQPQANVGDLLNALHVTLCKWLHDTPIEKNDNRWLKVKSIGVSVSSEWEVHLEWSYEDEELAGRVLGIAKQVINAEYAKTQA